MRRLLLTFFALIFATTAWAGPPVAPYVPQPTRVTLGQSRVPMILPSSGSMGNNGALTLTTAVDQTYPSAYFYMPAGAIAASGAGSAAGFYYGTMSSTTAVTLFNNLYVSGSPTIPASPTAFATTGPGAYTQTTGSFITAWSITIPGGLLGINDEVQTHGLVSINNNANAKTLQVSYGAFAIGTIAPTTVVVQSFQGSFANAGSLSRQSQTANSTMAIGGGSTLATNGTVNSASAQTFGASVKLAVATDYIIVVNINAERIVAAP